MIGLYGSVGHSDSNLDSILRIFNNDGNYRTSRYSKGNLDILYSDHKPSFEKQPASIEGGDVLVWVWGEILGHKYKGDYKKRPAGMSGSEFCASLYGSHGMPFVAGLNSEFAGVVYDRDSGTVSIFSDRLGSRPIYYHESGGQVIFSTSLQKLGQISDVEFEINPEIAPEFLEYGRSLGTATIANGISKLRPASVITYSIDGTRLDDWTYWWPNPSPKDLPYSHFVEEFAETLYEAVNDRIDNQATNGILLSGGLDSRTVLAASSSELVSFHMNETPVNNEAQLARKAAQISNSEFEFLNRSVSYYPNLLDKISGKYSLNGRFEIGHAYGFKKEISDKVENLFCSQYKNTLIDETYVPFDEGEPMSITNKTEYANAFDRGDMGGATGTIGYTKEMPSAKDVMLDRIYDNGSTIKCHGVKYPSWESLVQFGMVYPLTNVQSFVFYESNIHICRTQYPFLDNRIVDLVLQMPSDYRYGSDIVEDCIGKFDEYLATMRKTSQEPIKKRRYIQHLSNSPISKIPDNVLKKVGIIDGDVLLHSHLKEDSGWPNFNGLMRVHPFVSRKLSNNEEKLRQSPYFDFDEIVDCYESHVNSKDQYRKLSSILSLVESSLELVDSDAGEGKNDV